MDTLHIYTISNWHLIRYLWPSGDMNGNKYIVYMDTDSNEYMVKLAKLRAVSPYLADAVAVWTSVNGIVFTVHCPITSKRG